MVEHGFEIGIVKRMRIAEFEKNENDPVGPVRPGQTHQFITPAGDAAVLGRAHGPPGVAPGNGRNGVCVGIDRAGQAP